MDEPFAIDVLSGRRRGVVPVMLRSGCALAALGYGAAIQVRNWSYDRGWARTYSVDVPVISIGNITTGGTGKTPLSAYLARRLQSLGWRPGIVSRGYRQLSEQANDEQLMLEQLLPGLLQVMNRDRVAGAQTAIREHACDAILLDDGFQHRRLKRDLDIVLIDATRPWGFGRLLPRGLLREPLVGLQRADLIVITRCDQVSVAELADIRSELARWHGTPEAVEVRFTPHRWRNAAGETRNLADFSGANCLAFCGIGNPEGFRRTLQSAGLSVSPLAFPDHHHYTANDLESISRRADETGAAVLITTHKDLVKLPQPEIAGRPLWAVEITADIVSGGEWLDRALSTLPNVRRHAA